MTYIHDINDVMNLFTDIEIIRHYVNVSRVS